MRVESESVVQVNLAGTWKLWLDDSKERAKSDREIVKLMAGEVTVKERPNTLQDGMIELPGILQAQGFGDEITKETPWVSGLHDARWYEREEYQYGQENECQIPFLSQPPRHYVGRAWYEREIEITDEMEACGEELYLRIELAKWRSDVWLDGEYKGGDCSLCAAHEIPLGRLNAGVHRLTVCIDNRLQYPYRPDGHGVSDALGMMWNGMVGEIALIPESKRLEEWKEKQEYAKAHPRHIEVKDGLFWVDGHPEYFRGTHFAGEFPLTGYPETDEAWWDSLMKTLQEWGLNFIRFHSYCPPEAAFMAADRANIYLQVECAMWNEFSEGIPMLSVLKQETEKILRQFGHHPSFALFSPTNEPGGEWYRPLEQWVRETRAYDATLGYENRRVYTAQSGWFFDKAPKDITKDETDYIYFHRSAYGPFQGGAIRNQEGWHGKDYLPSVEGATLPIISHELGQWCSYPDFSVTEKFTGYLRPGNYNVFRENAKAMGVLWRNKEFADCSGKTQVMMYKEDLEANFRTPHLYGFELLDLHDYLGQGTALVGVLDAFWENKGYVTPEEFREFCDETVLLARIPSYTYKNTDCVEIPLEVCHFGKEELTKRRIVWEVRERDTEKVLRSGEWLPKTISVGKNQMIGQIDLDFSCVNTNKKVVLDIWMETADGIREARNHWDLYVFVKSEDEDKADSVFYTRDWTEAKQALAEGKTVVCSPYLSALDYNCPAVSMRPVFWNAQMGPGWVRNVGLAVEEQHPALSGFLTESYGGWVWEDILEQARGFRTDGMPEGWKPIVTVIDEWNRNFPLGLVFEGRVGDGKLLFISACLEGSFEERPAAYQLKHALLSYAASDAFCPNVEISPEFVEKSLYSAKSVENLDVVYRFDEDSRLVVRAGEALGHCNPNTSAYLEKEAFPFTVTVQMPKMQSVLGAVYLPEQKDRMHVGGICECMAEVWEEECWKPVWRGTFQNSYEFQRVTFDEEHVTNQVRFTIFSAYGTGERPVWKGRKEGWLPEYAEKQAVVQASVLAVTVKQQVKEDDERFWSGQRRTTTKEIDN